MRAVFHDDRFGLERPTQQFSLLEIVDASLRVGFHGCVIDFAVGASKWQVELRGASVEVKQPSVRELAVVRTFPAGYFDLCDSKRLANKQKK